MIWLSGGVAFWVGVGLAGINGYPLQTGLSLMGMVLLSLVQYAVVWKLRWGRVLLGGLALGLIPAYLGFYLQSGHWVSEIFVLGFLLSLAGGNALLAHGWQRQWALCTPGGADQPPDGALGGLGYTLANILLIIGLLLIWYFPATPLPGRDGAWVLAAVAVLNQEFVKRKYYGSRRGSTVLTWTAATFEAGLSFWLLAVLCLRGRG